MENLLNISGSQISLLIKGLPHIITLAKNGFN